MSERRRRGLKTGEDEPFGCFVILMVLLFAAAVFFLWSAYELAGR